MARTEVPSWPHAGMRSRSDTRACVSGAHARCRRVTMAQPTMANNEPGKPGPRLSFEAFFRVAAAPNADLVACSRPS